ncbi:hypothetical protein SDC9_40850 [bioreactor metagenome]|jgi:hypothetical protein|uniref:Uncharacterized protein n=1 Tax=bioreactor metagenome TaxID=1076179 RepID=A0A644VTF4_9ZZZZ|nr:DUF6391 domain-containing protein [Aminivibrio sp.]MEA4951839.1 DUF6391 domain-containing protein [Aminivibrio sp.]
MPFFVFVLLLFLFPWLAFAGLLLVIVLVSVGFTAKYVPGIFFSPAKLLRILFNKRVRANHGLAHGTISVLQERYGPLEIEGPAEEDGFSLRGGLDPEEVLSAARNALLRIRSGESSLVLSPKCAAASAVFLFCAIPCALLLALLEGFSALNAAIVLLLSFLLVRFTSPWIQRRLTFPLNLQGIEITGAESRKERKTFFGVELLVPSSVFVRTRFKGEPLVAEVVS